MESDIATALDYNFMDPNTEAKFNALKKLHSIKVKALMGSIDTLQKENSNLKISGKDSKRTQMILSLNSKVKDLELVINFLKNELLQKSNMEEDSRKFYSIEEVNNYIIRKTIGGPTRFYPVSREELENKLSENEKTIKKLEIKVNDMETELRKAKSSMNSNINNIQNTKDDLKSEPKYQNKSDKSVNYDSAKSEYKNDNVKILQLMDELNSVKKDLEIKTISLEESKEEISRLRLKNAELKMQNEKNVLDKNMYEDALALYHKTDEELNFTSQSLVMAEEELRISKANSIAELDGAKIEIDTIISNYERLLRQNTVLLEQIAKLEMEKDAIEEKKLKALI